MLPTQYDQEKSNISQPNKRPDGQATVLHSTLAQPPAAGWSFCRWHSAGNSPDHEGRDGRADEGEAQDRAQVPEEEFLQRHGAGGGGRCMNGPITGVAAAQLLSPAAAERRQTATARERSCPPPQSLPADRPARETAGRRTPSLRVHGTL